ncbi:MAG: hypothetical protein ACSHX8_04870 [Opitutaceae bacterium]
MVAVFKTLAFWMAAALLAAVALLVPANLRTIDRSVLELAAQSESTNEATIQVTVNAAQVGPAKRLLAATKTDPSTFENTLERLLEKSPRFAISGGADRTFEDFLELVQISKVQNNAVVPLLLPRSERASLSGMLAASSNANVAALLDIRNLNGLIRLHPADHAAGAPYDSGLLTLALLIEGGHFQPTLAQQIGSLANQASLRTPSAIRACEDLVIATLSLGRQLDYRSLANLAAITNNPSEWAQMATLFRAQPDRINQLYTALTFSGNSANVFNYLAANPDTGNRDLDEALQLGAGSTNYLLQAEQPIYRPAPMAAQTLKLINGLRPDFFVTLAHGNKHLGLSLKFGLFTLAGLAFAFGMGAAWRASLGKAQPEISKTNPVVWARDALLSLVVAMTIWTFFEPDILKSKDTTVDAGPRIEFAVADTLQSLQSPVKAMQELNQVTLLVLALFFIIQLVIYSFCLIKLREVAKQNLSAEMKIKLLENEENLFDFGLYVGLGGTVLSLILVAVGIVEASLMAAYASTLFGILFTAILKVMHLRPYRRTLIIEAGINNGDKSGSLMSGIKL